MKETELIKKYLFPISKNFKPSIYLQDDGAILKSFDKENFIISVDSFIQGIHCPSFLDPKAMVIRAIFCKLIHMKKLTVIVVGGGIAGLTAAALLAHEGLEVVLIEAHYDQSFTLLSYAKITRHYISINECVVSSKPFTRRLWM